ncbi:MAG: hypothetical protein ACKVOW_13475, partial [Chitinophagaceae bacterium]
KGGKEAAQQIQYGYESMMFKPISDKRLSALVQLYNNSIRRFKKDEKASCEMIGAMNEHTNPESAALVVVANALLNLDEWVNKN